MFGCVPKTPLLPIKKIILHGINYITNFALQSSNRANIIRETFIFYSLLP